MMWAKTFLPEFDISRIDNIKVDAVVISDYNKGFLDMAPLNNYVKSLRPRVFADTKNKAWMFSDCYIKINEKSLVIKRMPENCEFIITMGPKVLCMIIRCSS